MTAAVLAGVASAAEPPKKQSAKDLFGLATMHEFQLELAAKDWDRMQPTGGMRFPGAGPGGFGPPGGPPAADDKNADVHRGNGFGLTFPWVHANFIHAGQTLRDVGLRFKGNASYMASSRGLKRNFKVDFNHYDEDKNFHGLKSINLNAGAMDPTRAHEALSYAVFRAAGVPAPRTAFAQVTLTIPGKYDRELLGTYTVVEQVSKTFLKDHFKSAKGLLLKPEGVRAMDYLGDDWAPYERRYGAKTDADPKLRKRLIDFARLVHLADDAAFRKEVGSYVDVDEFLRFVAVNALIANLDGVFMMGHNYYLYLPSESGKFVFMPWDLDLSFAGFPMAGGPEQQADLSLTHPFAGDNRLFDRLMAMKEVSEQYHKILKELASTCFAKEALLKQVDAIEQVIKEPLAKERAAAEKRKEFAGGFGPPGGDVFIRPGGGPPGGGPRDMFGRGNDLRTFITRRTESVAAQLAGKSKGTVPQIGLGPGGPGRPGMMPFAPPRPGELLPGPLQEMLRLSDEQKKQLAELQKKFDGELDKILTDEQRKQIKELRERGPFGPPGGPPGGFGPPGFGPPQERRP
jgi:spore coat protein CotH